MGVSQSTDKGTEAQGGSCFCPHPTTLPSPLSAPDSVPLILLPLRLLHFFLPPHDLGAVLLLASISLWGLPGPSKQRGTATHLGAVMCVDSPASACSPPPTTLPSLPLEHSHTHTHAHKHTCCLELPPPLLLTVPFSHELHVCHLVLGNCQASSRISINSPGAWLAAGAHQRDWGRGWLPLLLEPARAWASQRR